MTQTSPQSTTIAEVNENLEMARTALRDAIDTVHTGANTNTDVVAGQELVESLPEIRDAVEGVDQALGTLQSEVDNENRESVVRGLEAAQRDYGVSDLLTSLEAELGDSAFVIGRNPAIEALDVEPLLLDLQDALERKHRCARTVLRMLDS